MKTPSFRTSLVLAVDAALLVICILHIPILLERAHPPLGLTSENGRVVVDEVIDSSASHTVGVGDTLRTWNGQLLTNEHEVEFLSDFSSIGDDVFVRYGRSAVDRPDTVRLIPMYNILYVILVLVVGIVAWGLGVFVLLRRPHDKTATVLHWSMVMMGVAVMLTFGKATPGSNWVYFTRLLFLVVYGSVAMTFLHLTLVFPRFVPQATWRIVAVYLPMSLLVLVMSYVHVRALNQTSIQLFNTFQALFDIFHIVLVLYVGFGMLLFIRSYITSETFEEKKKLKWVLWGLMVGPLPFLLLTIIPQYYLPFGFVPEELTLIFLVVIPVTFAISFVRYHLLDIEIVINRTTVYGIVLGAVITCYVIIVGVIAASVGTNTVGNSAAAAALLALLFEPARRRVQHAVDKRFFRVRYDFRKALRLISDEITRCVDAQELADLLIARIDEIIPVQRIGVFLLRQSDKRLYLLSHRGFDLLELRTIRFRVESLKTQLTLPVALDSTVEAGVEFESADERVFTRWGMALVLPMKTAAGEFVGFLVLGSKKSGERFRIEDVDLVVNTSREAGIEFERIALQLKLLEEQAENQRLAELNRLKSDFVSNVSHEFRTPLTSIKLYAEMLISSPPSARKFRTYMKTIVGEADRLDRMVTNVLDSSKIERGVPHYTMQVIDLRDVVERVLRMMKYQLDKNGFTPIYIRPHRCVQIQADPDAVAEAIMNLIDNAIKFSTATRFLKLSLGRAGSRVRCTVQDRGRGISAEALPHLFERFYRDPASSESVQGVGLGLPLVKRIMTEHGGSVEVTSTPGKGSTFTLWFALYSQSRETKKENPRH